MCAAQLMTEVDMFCLTVLIYCKSSFSLALVVYNKMYISMLIVL